MLILTYACELNISYLWFYMLKLYCSSNDVLVTLFILYYSDDRSPEVFKKMLESSTEMKAVLTSNSKPNCLIIDEIDGAPAVSLLLIT